MRDCGQFYSPRSPEFKGKLKQEAVRELAAVSGQHQGDIINPLDNPARYTPDDKGNGYLFADGFQNELRYCPEAKAWYCYDGSRWTAGGNEMARERAKALADYLWRIAPGVADMDAQKRFVGNAVALRNQQKREVALKDAQSVYPLRLSRLDESVSLLNCRNCTLNLSDRAVLDHNPSHMLSKVAGADFVKGARCERWERFIDEIMMGDKEAARYLQKLSGYCLTGKPAEEKLFILYGATTRNGKSTLLDTLAAVLGDYARSMLPEALAEPRNLEAGKASPDWARMAGVRLCTVNEPPKGLLLNAAKVKSVTGRDTITARFLNCEFFDYKPQFSIVVNTNHRPAISDPTVFASGRIVVIPFNRHFEEHEQDKRLKAELRTPQALSGVLAWMLEGLRLYRADGLEAPQSIRAEIATYQHDSDKITQFIEECIEIVPNMGLATQMSSVYGAYQDWCKANGFCAESMHKFSPALTAKGVRIDRRTAGRFAIDLRLNIFGL